MATSFGSRGFIFVYEGVQLGGIESPPIVFGAGHVPVGLSKRGRDTESGCKYPAERNALNFSQRIFHPHFHLEIEGHDSLVPFLLAKRGCLAESDSPVFGAMGRRSWLICRTSALPASMIIFLTISPPMLPACAEVKSPL